jgi:hypothetical protein
MADVKITYNNTDIVEMSDSDTVVLETSGKNMADNVSVKYVKPVPSLQEKTVSPSLTLQTVLPDNGYDGLASVTVGAILPQRSAQTYTPTTSTQVIPSGRWLKGDQTILGDANLVAGNIKKDVSIFGVTGTYEGEGGGIPGLTGSFTTQASTGAQTINIPYTGNGYPVSVQITIDGGAWSKTSFTKGEIQLASLVKEQPAVTPTYSGLATNGAGVLAVYARDIYGSKGYIDSDSSHYTGTAPTTGNPLRVSANNQIKVYVSAASGTNGFLANQKYNYSIVYSE